MLNSNTHTELNQHRDTTDAALDRIAIAVAAKLKATGTLDTYASLTMQLSIMTRNET
jgi:hypothetical protein